MRRARTVSRWLLVAIAALALIAAVGLAFCQYKYTSAPQVRVLSAGDLIHWSVDAERVSRYKALADALRSGIRDRLTESQRRTRTNDALQITAP